MNRPTGPAALAFAVALLFAASAAFAALPTTGSATYKVTASSPMGSYSAVVNETVRGSHTAGFSDLVLQLTGTTQNLTYSRLVNSSEALLPFMPTVPSQSFDYSNGTLSVHANLTQAAPQSVSFGGSSYAMTVYDVSLAGSYGNRSLAAAGTVEAFPSSLVYSVELSGAMFQASVVLQGTNLPLSQPSTVSATAAYTGAGLTAVGVTAAAALVIRRRERRSKAQEQKPLHWVD